MISPSQDSSFFLNKEQISDIIQRLSQEPIPADQDERLLFNQDRIAVYKMIFSNIITLPLEDEEIIQLWNNVNLHKFFMSEKLGRDIGFRVAALDYLFNTECRIKNPMIIENASYESILNESRTDCKTGLLNPRALYRQLDQEIDRSKRYGLVFSLLFIDLDNFKRYNDTLGHIAGDTLLEGFAEQLSEQLRSIDMAGRFGGDEFCILFPQTHRATALIAATRIQRILDSVVEPSIQEETGLSLSGGLVMFPFNGISRQSLFQAADSALYRAKAGGRDRILSMPDKKYRAIFSSEIHFSIKARNGYDPLSVDDLQLSENGLAMRLPDSKSLADPELLGFHIRITIEANQHSLMLPRDRIILQDDTVWLELDFQHENEVMTLILQRLDLEQTFPQQQPQAGD